MMPCMANVCTMTVADEELWSIAVNSTPKSIARNGFSSPLRNCANSGLSASGLMAFLTMERPKKSMPNPMMMEPTCLTMVLLMKRYRIAPMKTMSGA